MGWLNIEFCLLALTVAAGAPIPEGAPSASPAPTPHQAPGDAPLSSIPPRTVAVLLLEPKGLSSRTVSGLHAQTTKALNDAEFKPVPQVDLRTSSSPPGDPTCFEDEACLFTAAERLEVELLLLVHLQRNARQFEARVKLWHPKVPVEWATVPPVASRNVLAEVGKAVDEALKRFSSAWDARIVQESLAASSPAPQEALRATSIPKAPPAVDFGSVAETSDEETTGTGASELGLWVGVGGEMFPVQHRASRLAVGGAVGGLDVAAPAVSAQLRVRLPELPLDEVHVVAGFAYAFDDPLMVFGLVAGLEKRFEIGRFLPLVGARYALTWVGLPAPAADGPMTAYALSHGFEVFGGAAIDLHPAPLQVQIEAGARVHPLRTQQFESRGAVYYSRDTGGQIWVVDLTGPMVRLVVLVGWG